MAEPISPIFAPETSVKGGDGPGVLSKIPWRIVGVLVTVLVLAIATWYGWTLWQARAAMTVAPKVESVSAGYDLQADIDDLEAKQRRILAKLKQ